MTDRTTWGVSPGWWGVDGAWHDVDPDTSTTLEHLQGAGEHPEGPPTDPVWFVTEGDAAALLSPGLITLGDGDGEARADAHLPPDLPLGAHLLAPLDGGPTTRLFVVPARAPRPGRGWGWSAQLYAVHSGSSWGHGDLVDLGALARWAHEGGASVVAHNPLGATIPLPAQQPSPYFASTRRFTSPLYLRVESVLGADRVSDAVATAAQAGRALNDHRRIDRDQVWALKLGALEAIWAEVRCSSVVRDAFDHADHDRLLHAHAVFCALAEHHGSGWQQWPQGHRHPDSNDVASFASAHVERVDFWRWVQIECEVQLDHAGSAGAGLIGDLPVGFDPDGFDAWIDQDQLALGARIGAPPDELGPLGQDWGLPPYVPWKLRNDGYAAWIDTLRRSMRHVAALRIDHVMGLFRLFWIPPGADARSGGYVYQYGSELLDLTVMEAARAGVALVGEDLGTVEPEVREALAQRDVFGYRVGWFSQDPQHWPANTLGMLTTHDLPTVPGLWTGVDAAIRAEAGLPADPDADERLRSNLASLAAHGGLADPDDADADEVTDAAHTALAAAGSDLVLVTLEDAVGVRERPNVPGTVDERPNWRLALPVTIEELDRTGAATVASVMKEARR